MLRAIQLGDLEQTNPLASKVCNFTHPFECVSSVAPLVLLGNRQE